MIDLIHKNNLIVNFIRFKSNTYLPKKDYLRTGLWLNWLKFFGFRQRIFRICMLLFFWPCSLTLNNEKNLGTYHATLSMHYRVYVHAICSYNERWDFPNNGSSLFLSRFSLLTFLSFLGLFFIFSEIFTCGFL